MASNKQMQAIGGAMGMPGQRTFGRRIRDISLVLLPTLAIGAGLVWLAMKFVKPAPPSVVTITTGGEAGAYYPISQRYANVLKRDGITLKIQTSAGSLENIARMKNPEAEASVALVQGGISNSDDAPNVVSLGRIMPEPLWIFYRDANRLDKLDDLKGKRLAVGPDGSGTRKLAIALLKAHGLNEQSATLLPLAGQQAVDGIVNGSIDATFIVSAPEAASVRALMSADNVRLMSLTHAEAYTRLFPYLQKIVLPEGAMDLVKNIPPHDVQMVAPVAALVAKSNLHPAIIGLLVEAATEVHSRGGLFHRVGDFPRPLDPEFEMSEDAIRYFKTGPSFLKRHLPFWMATFIERIGLIAVPLLGALVPLSKMGPSLYRWLVRRRILYWYGRLKALESTVAADRTGQYRDTYLAEVARIDDAVNTIAVPPSFTDQYYALRAAIGLVRQRLTATGTALPRDASAAALSAG